MIHCLNSATLGKGSFEEYLDAAAAAGFPAVDVGIEPFQAAAEKASTAAADMLGRRRLIAASFGASPDWRNDEAKFNESLAPFPRQAKLAAELNIRRCLTWISPVAQVPFKERWAQIVPRLKRVYEILTDSGISFGIEFIGPKTLRQKGHEFIHTMEQGLELAAAIGPKAGLLLDSFHWYTSGATLKDLEAVPVEKIIHVHINDAPDRPPEEQIDGERLLPGEGVIDLKGFLSCLRGKNYSGAVSVETFNADLRKLPMADAARKAKAALEKVAAG
jgi:sugar phosphate isomerase/epimerase